MLSKDQRRALDCANGRSWFEPTQIGEGVPDDLRKRPQLWSGLARRGFLETFRNSEQVRGERRVHWVEYRITEAGRTALGDRTEGG